MPSMRSASCKSLIPLIWLQVSGRIKPKTTQPR